MMMSNGEIVMSYRLAKNKKAQIGILADLNCCRRKEIVDILEQKGELKSREDKGMETKAKTTKTKTNVRQQASKPKTEPIPESVSKALMNRIDQLDEIIQEATTEYKEIVGFLGVGGCDE